MIVHFPATLSRNGARGMIEVDVRAATTLRSLFDEIEKRVPGATNRVLDANGKPFGYVNLYVNGNDIRHEAGMGTSVREGDEILILPAISGG
jgi:sulfur-carrier protein